VNTKWQIKDLFKLDCPCQQTETVKKFCYKLLFNKLQTKLGEVCQGLCSKTF